MPKSSQVLFVKFPCRANFSFLFSALLPCYVISLFFRLSTCPKKPNPNTQKYSPPQKKPLNSSKIYFTQDVTNGVRVSQLYNARGKKLAVAAVQGRNSA